MAEIILGTHDYAVWHLPLKLRMFGIDLKLKWMDGKTATKVVGPLRGNIIRRYSFSTAILNWYEVLRPETAGAGTNN